MESRCAKSCMHGARGIAMSRLGDGGAAALAARHAPAPSLRFRRCSCSHGWRSYQIGRGKCKHGWMHALRCEAHTHPRVAAQPHRRRHSPVRRPQRPASPGSLFYMSLSGGRRVEDEAGHGDRRGVEHLGHVQAVAVVVIPGLALLDGRAVLRQGRANLMHQGHCTVVAA